MNEEDQSKLFQLLKYGKGGDSVLGPLIQKYGIPVLSNFIFQNNLTALFLEYEKNSCRDGRDQQALRDFVQEVADGAGIDHSDKDARHKIGVAALNLKLEVEATNPAVRGGIANLFRTALKKAPNARQYAREQLSRATAQTTAPATAKEAAPTTARRVAGKSCECTRTTIYYISHFFVHSSLAYVNYNLNPGTPVAGAAASASASTSSSPFGSSSGNNASGSTPAAAAAATATSDTYAFGSGSTSGAAAGNDSKLGQSLPVHGPSPVDQTPAAPVPFRDRNLRGMLHDFYMTNNPEKLKDRLFVDKLLLRWAGREEQMFRTVAKTYNKDPSIFGITATQTPTNTPPAFGSPVPLVGSMTGAGFGNRGIGSWGGHQQQVSHSRGGKENFVNAPAPPASSQSSSAGDDFLSSNIGVGLSKMSVSNGVKDIDMGEPKEDSADR